MRRRAAANRRAASNRRRDEAVHGHSRTPPRHFPLFASAGLSTRLAPGCASRRWLFLVARGSPRRPPRAPPTTSRAAAAVSPRPPRRGAARRPAAAAAPPPAAPAPPARPRPPSARPPKEFPKLRQASLVHKYQLGIAVLPGIGFRGIFPYEESIHCGQQAKRVCTGMLPFFIDVQPSFGFAEHWDMLVDLRFGIVTDFTTSHQFAVAPGFRYWVDPELPFKFYATIQGVFDATAQNNPRLKNTDFGIRNANGFMFEVMRNLGFYIQLGETIGFVRWLRSRSTAAWAFKPEFRDVRARNSN